MEDGATPHAVLDPFDLAEEQRESALLDPGRKGRKSCTDTDLNSWCDAGLRKSGLAGTLYSWWELGLELDLDPG